VEFRELGKTGIRVSALGLGGHEFHPDGRLKGFSDDSKAAVLPGYVNKDFGGPVRQALVQRAIEAGVNYFDATQDPEVTALGECLACSAGKKTVLMQCRPQGMCYHYDAGNRALADPTRLEAEVRRLIALAGRAKIDVLNFGIEASALAEDSEYTEKIAENIQKLKDKGLIRLAACDSLRSGENVYLQLMESECFDVVWLNFGPLCPFPSHRIFPLAEELGMGIVVREAFNKGNLFRAALADGTIENPAELAGAAMRWILSHIEISTLVVGVKNAAEFELNFAAVSHELTEQDVALLDRVRGGPAFGAALAEQEKAFRVANM
jgi:aryl-alcohol dehydrogenase-like predicted oxidoreductase